MRAVVTGAASGIGLALSKLLLKENYHIIGIDKDEKHLAKASEELGNFTPILCDVTKEKEVRETCERITKDGEINLLVNNAGVLYLSDFNFLSIGKMKEMMGTNYWGTVYFTKYLLGFMPPGSRLVNVSSIIGRLGLPKWSGYAASKFAVAGLSESLYYELKDKGISVTLVCPAGVNTNLYEKCGWDEETIKRRTEKMMSPEYVAKKIWEAAEKRKFETEITLKDSWIVKLKNFLPSVFRKIVLQRSA